MLFDLDLIELVYDKLQEKIIKAREVLGHPLSLSEKILYSHLSEPAYNLPFKRGEHYVDYSPDRIAMQDATAQMAVLQFVNAGKTQVSVPTSIHCDHLIQASKGARHDLNAAKLDNNEVYEFLDSASQKYGIAFWKPGAGIIHQVVLENYAFPGGMMIGTDSHTVNAGGLGMIAIGVGGADAVDVMAGMPWELKMPKLIGVKLTGKLHNWASPKDVILKLAGILSVKGGTGFIVEYFGEGAKTISCTGKGTICNMGAEIGATTSIFSYDDKMSEYLSNTGRSEIARLADNISEHLSIDKEVEEDPEKYFDRFIEIDLSVLEPYINGPFSPDRAYKLSEFSQAVKDNDFPKKLEVGLIGSCTNSSYEDLSRAASIAKQAGEKNLHVKSEFIVSPGSEMIRATAERDGLLSEFEKIGGVVMANACGPCIGQWKRHIDEPNRRNSILTSFNRNFAKRNDGNANTHGFVASPEIVTAFAIAGTLCFNPITDALINEDGEEVFLKEPSGTVFPPKGFSMGDLSYIPHGNVGDNIKLLVDAKSKRLQLLTPFLAWNGNDNLNLSLLIKVKGKCTTDHISMAGVWLRYRGHLDNISDNMLIGATNYFNDKVNSVFNIVKEAYTSVPESARDLKAQNLSSIIIAEDNYGEGSSREHAAMEPRFLGVKAVLVKSFARIHETNLKKQGVLALTFSNIEDYELIEEYDDFLILGLKEFSPEKNVKIKITHRNGNVDIISCNHTYNDLQIKWFRLGSALNLISKNNER